MANATVLNIGQNNGSGATDALFLKIYGGEVLTAFERECVMKDKHFVRTISHGKSAQFPATWKVSANLHTPGTEIVGQTSNVSERVITIDGLVLADVFIPNIDEAKNHFDYRSVYSAETGRVLAERWDKIVLQVGVNAARASATVTGAFGGTQLTSLTTLYKTSASDLASGIFAAVQTLAEKDIPEGKVKNVFIKPAQYYMLAQSKDLVNQDWASGGGNLADGKILKIAGCPLVMTNNLPTTNIVTGETHYQGDFTKTAALVMTADAVGTLKLMDLQKEMEYDMRRQGTLLIAKYAMGTGILRPECAVELKTTS
jgi:hypothetical protein